MKWIWGKLPLLFFLILILGIGLLYTRIQEKKSLLEAQKASELKQNQAKVNVVTLKTSPSTVRDRIDLPGTITPYMELKVLAEVRGKIIEKKVKEGDFVKKGDSLALLDSRDYNNALLSAGSSHEAAQASLNRIKALYKDQLATRSQLDEAEARTQNLKAAMDNAALNVERCNVRSDMAGIVERVDFEAGQFVNVGDFMAKVIRIDRVKVRVGIPESDVGDVRKVNEFDLKIDALGGKGFRGKKEVLSKTAEPGTRVYPLSLVVENPTLEILPDMFARVQIIKRQIRDGISVPLFAVINRNKEKIVYIINDEHVHARTVELGLMDGWKVEVKSGLNPGDQVVVVGQRDVNPGQAVNVVRTVDRMEELEK
ncbi:MAG: efflux RND transporter periplasmic adaptor subunit [Thermodesulfobacteriota bacterium]